MATVGNLASVQLNMAKAATKTGVSGSSLYGTTLDSTKNITVNTASAKKAAQENLDKLLNTTLKGESDYFREQYTALYKSVFGLTDEASEKADETTSLKTAASNAETAANELERFAGKLTYGEEYSTEDYTKAVEKFVESYNSMIDKVGNSDNQSVLQKGVVMVNTAKVYKGALSRAGITLGSDNKLSFDKDKLSKVSATDIKSTFGTFGFASKVAQKAQQINRLSGSAGAFSYNNVSAQNYSYNIGALLSTYA